VEAARMVGRRGRRRRAPGNARRETKAIVREACRTRIQIPVMARFGVLHQQTLPHPCAQIDAADHVMTGWIVDVEGVVAAHHLADRRR
jgi:hypothetical protein